MKQIENKERDVKPNQFKLLTHCDCFFFRTYIQFKNKYGKVKLLLSKTDKTYREVDTKKQTTLELFFSCYHVPKKTDILNLESKVKRNNEKNKK